MKSVDIREAKLNLSRLVAQAAHGESFVITRAGKALVKVVAAEHRRRSGCAGWVSCRTN